MEKTKSKARKAPKMDKLSLRIQHASRAIDKRRKERAERAYERTLLSLG